MRAMVLTQPKPVAEKPLSLRDLPVPDPAAGQVRIRPQMDYQLIYHERVVRSVANSTRQDAREFLELAAEVPVRTEVQTFALERANEALLALKQSRIDGAGVLQIA